MRRHLSTILLVVGLVAGLCLLMYPTVSDYWNSLHQSRAIATYAEQVADIDVDLYGDIWASAEDYNARLAETGNLWVMSDEQRADYAAQLDVSGLGIMSYIEIPAIKCSLPIYHGTEESVLQIAVGHLEGTSLPVGGEGTHAVFSAHRGLPSAKLFTDLDKLVVGDIFMLRTLDEVLTYEVDQILIVEPHEIAAVELVPGEDLCTLVTCTPYGINTHRLLVRGHRVENQELAKTVRVTADAMQVDPLIVAPVVATPILLALLVVLVAGTRKRG